MKITQSGGAVDVIFCAMKGFHGYHAVAGVLIIFSEIIFLLISYIDLIDRYN